MRIVGIHLRPPVSAEWSAERNRQLSDLAALARREIDPLVLVGDFNVTPYSPFFTQTLASAGLRDSGRARGVHFSWPTFFPILGIPIDLCVISGHLAVLEHRRGPGIGSDHYPIIATVALR